MSLNTKSRTRSEYMKWKILLIILLFLLCQNLFNQSITWQRTYKQYDYNLGKSACQTSDGNFVIVGQATGNKVFAMKINPLGDTLWSTIQNSMSNSLARSVAPTNNGGAVMAGNWNSAFVIKLNSLGQIEWTKTLSGMGSVTQIKNSTDGGYILCGYFFTSNIESAFLHKIDSLGNLLWHREYSSGYKMRFSSLELGVNGGYIMTGTVQDSAMNPEKTLLFKVSDNGDSLWEKRISFSSSIPVGLKIRKLSQSYLIAGSCTDSSGRDQIFTCKTNLQGDTVRVVRYPTNGRNEYFGDMVVLNENRYVLCYMRDSVTINYSAVGMIVDSSGNILIKKNFANSTYFLWGNLNTVTPIANGDLLFTGTAKITQPYGGEWVYAVRTDSLLNTPVIGINLGNELLPNDFGLLQNYPNPFNPETKIKYSLPKTSMVKLVIYDALGKVVNTLVNEEQAAGIYEINVDGLKGLASGIYFYRISAGSFTDVKKMVLLK